MTSFRADRGSRRWPVSDAPRRNALLLVGSAVTLVLVLLLTALLLVSRSVSDDYVLNEAARDARRIATNVAGPLVDEQVRAGDPEALRRLTNALMVRVRDGSAKHIQIWDRDGRILWADQPSRIGRQFDLDAPTAALLDTLDELAEVTRLDEEEHEGLDPGAEMIEVYVGSLDSDRQPFLLETYLSPASVTAHHNAVLVALVPVAVGLLALRILIAVPAVWLGVRRSRQTKEANARIVENALSAWHAERRRIAQDLHDGVVQNLSAVSYALPGVLDMLPDDPSSAHAKAYSGRPRSRPPTTTGGRRSCAAPSRVRSSSCWRCHSGRPCRRRRSPSSCGRASRRRRTWRRWRAMCASRGAVGRTDGELLATEPYAGWANQARWTFQERLVDRCTAAAATAGAAGDDGLAVQLARAAVMQPCLSERARQELIKALFRSGERAQALTIYAEMRRQMVEELGRLLLSPLFAGDRPLSEARSG